MILSQHAIKNKPERNYTPLYTKGTKQTQNKSMETTDQTQEMCAKWTWKWLSSFNWRQSKIFFKSPCKTKSKQLFLSGRENFGRAFRWLSGHNFLRCHNNLVDRENYPHSMCRLCNLEEETSIRIVFPE